MHRTLVFVITIVFLLTGCRRAAERETFVLETAESPPETVAVESYWDPVESLTAEDIERGRLEDGWRRAPSIDSLLATVRPPGGGMAPDTGRAGSDPLAGRSPGRPGTTPRAPDSLDVEVRFPIGPNAPSRSVLATQILLDRSPYKPGVIDGKWGKNTEKAVLWLQRRAGLDPTGTIDSTTFASAYDLAGRPARLLMTHRLTTEDVAGPFVQIPEDVYARAELSCLCYTSLSEKLGERFHATPALLAELNPGVDLDRLAAGDSLIVPAVDDAPAPAGSVAAIVVSDQGRYLHAVDGTGEVVLHFPTTLGSRYHPSPTGEFRVNSIHRDPWFHWQPQLLEGVPDQNRPTRLPPGPNSPVGVVWIDLSIEHYGIHGTAEPATIGYATSSGCIRLTNWDAKLLASLVQPGAPVRFRDLEEGAELERETALR